MTQDFVLWKHQVRGAVGGLRNFPASSGTPGGAAPNAGFRQALQLLYAESRFAEFLACQAWRQAGLDEATGQALRTLQQQLDAYDEPDTDAAIWADPGWWAILGHPGPGRLGRGPAGLAARVGWEGSTTRASLPP